VTQVANKRQLKAKVQNSPAAVRTYFSELPELLDSSSLDVALAYVFARVELAHNMSLYCGVVKLHSVNSEVARSVIESFHLTRDGFLEKAEVVLGRAIPKDVISLLRDAEKTRDKVMHGKKTLDSEKRQALAKAIEYATGFNAFVSAVGNFEPFGDLRGFHGRGTSLPKATSRWVLRGMGFKA
jgi:hypothetical protein